MADLQMLALIYGYECRQSHQHAKRIWNESKDTLQNAALMYTYTLYFGKNEC